MIWFGLAEFFVAAFDCNPAPSQKLGSESVPASSFCQEFCSCNIAKTRIDPALFVLSYDISRRTRFWKQLNSFGFFRSRFSYYPKD